MNKMKVLSRGERGSGDFRGGDDLTKRRERTMSAITIRADRSDRKPEDVGICAFNCSEFKLKLGLKYQA